MISERSIDFQWFVDFDLLLLFYCHCLGTAIASAIAISFFTPLGASGSLGPRRPPGALAAWAREPEDPWGPGGPRTVWGPTKSQLISWFACKRHGIQ